ncbi:MAG: DUF4245 domain-containing protein [Lapillicoccus sp.]
MTTSSTPPQPPAALDAPEAPQAAELPTAPEVPEEPDAVLPPTRPAPPPSRYSMGSSANMVRSLLVIVGLVAVLIAIVPRISAVDQPAVDAASVVGNAVRDSGIAYEAPLGLPAGWKATNARYDQSTDGALTWQAGWTTPKGGYVAIRQAKAVTQKWIQVATDQGEPEGAVQAAGRTWEKRYSAAHDQTSLVDEHPDELTTVVTATASTDELLTFTNALKPAAAR